jgi:hypothetical protein
MRRRLTVVAPGLVLFVLTAPAFAADGEPPARPEVAAALLPYPDRYPLAGAIGDVADRGGPVRSTTLLG